MLANTCGTDLAKLNAIMAQMQDIQMPVPKEVLKGQDDMSVYVAPMAVDDNPDDIYVSPSQMPDYICPGPAPKPIERKTTQIKRDLARQLIRIECLKFEKLLGQGSFGKVLLASVRGNFQKLYSFH